MHSYTIILEIIIGVFVIVATIYALYLILSPNNIETVTFFNKLKPINTYHQNTNVDVYYKLFDDNISTNRNIAVWSSACVLAFILLGFIMCVNRLADIHPSISYYACIYLLLFGVLFLAFTWFSYTYMIKMSNYNQELMNRIREKTIAK